MLGEPWQSVSRDAAAGPQGRGTHGALAYAGGEPLACGVIRHVAEDFRVEEVLGFEPAGHGEHVLLRARKRGITTDEAARRLAHHAGVRPGAVGYAGLKDRHAVAEQWFTVGLAGAREPDWEALGGGELRVLSAARHTRKLRRGAHRANRFVIVVRDVRGDAGELDERLHRLAREGMPNYFGAQRFGRRGDNVAQAQALFRGAKPRSRVQRGLYLSAARAQLFNVLLSRRVAAASWNRALVGDVLQLDGRGSVFAVPVLSADIVARVAALALHPTGPLWGRGERLVSAAPAALEAEVAAAHADLAAGLERAGLACARRALRARLAELEWERPAGGRLCLAFELARGGYATSVLRECVRTR